MKLFTNKVLLDSNVSSELTNVLTAHENNIAALIETAKFFTSQNETVKKSFVLCFSTNPHKGISEIEELAKGHVDGSNDLISEMNKAGWMKILKILNAKLCPLAKEFFSDATFWAKKVPMLDKVNLVDQLNKISDIQEVSESAKELHKEIELNEGAELEFGQFKAKKVTVSQLNKLHSLMAQMKMHLVYIQTKAHFKNLADESIDKQLSEAQANHGAVKTQVLEVKFFKNGNIEVKHSLNNAVKKFI